MTSVYTSPFRPMVSIRDIAGGESRIATDEDTTADGWWKWTIATGVIKTVAGASERTLHEAQGLPTREALPYGHVGDGDGSISVVTE